MDKISFLKLNEVLEEKGKTFYSLRKDKIVGTETIRKLQQNNGSIDTRTIKNICAYLECQPGDIMRYLPEWVENRILELTELREEELKEWYEDRWSMDDSFEENLGLQYSEEYLPEIIEKLEDDEEIDPDYIEALREVCFHFPQSEDEITEKYPEHSQSIIDFFAPYLEEYNEELEKEHQEYIDEKVKEALEEEKADIEKQAFEEYFSDSEEE